MTCSKASHWELLNPNDKDLNLDSVIQTIALFFSDLTD